MRAELAETSAEGSVRQEIALIAAVARNGVIGNGGGLPWRLPSDLKRFKQLTMGRPVIMGRKTWESIGRPLPGRLNIVVSRSPGFGADGAKKAGSLSQALEIAAAEQPGPGEVFEIGGGELYAQAMPYAARLYVTHVMAEPAGDTLFPEIDPVTWQLFSSENIERAPEDTADMRLAVYERRSG
jgi:dihydrofolate reductase